MNEFQFDLVKLFLNVFRVPEKRIAREWKIEPMLMRMAASSNNFEAFNDLQNLSGQGGVFR